MVNNATDYSLFIAIIIVFAIIYLFWLLRQASPRSKIDKFVKSGVGKQDAIRAIREVRNPVAEDHFTAAIIEADDIDAGDGVEGVFGQLGQAMAELADRPAQDVDFGDFMVRRAGDIRDGTVVADTQMELAFALDRAINGARETTTQAVEVDRVTRAKNANTRKEALSITFAPVHTSDSQNVHERGVLTDTKRIIDILRESSPKYPFKKCAKDASDLCKTYLDKNKLVFANAALDKIREGSSIYALSANESDIFALVWSRADHENNRENSALIREAICDALYDCIDAEGGKPVCITGRATRVVGALATLDFDGDTSDVMTYEMHKNALFEDCKKCVEDSMLDKSRGATLYENGDDPDTTEDIAALKEFKDKLRREITQIIEDYSDRLSGDDIAQMTKKCYLFADIN